LHVFNKLRKIYTKISLGPETSTDLLQEHHLEIPGGIWVGYEKTGFLLEKLAISPKRSKTKTRLLVSDYIKLHANFQLVSRPWYDLSTYSTSSGIV